MCGQESMIANYITEQALKRDISCEVYGAILLILRGVTFVEFGEGLLINFSL